MTVSFQAKLLKALQQRISECAPEVNWVAQDFGQLEYFDLHPSVAWPCVLIDFPETTFNTEESFALWGDVTISVRLAFAPYDNDMSTEEIQNKAEAYWQTESNIYSALHNWQPVDENNEILCNPLMFFRSVTEKRDNDYLLQLYFLKDAEGRRENSLRVRNLQFQTSFEQNIGVSYTKWPDTPTFDF